MCLRVATFQELRNAHSDEIMGIRREEEMEMSDDDSDEIPSKRMRSEENGALDKCHLPLIHIFLKTLNHIYKSSRVRCLQTGDDLYFLSCVLLFFLCLNFGLSSRRSV